MSCLEKKTENKKYSKFRRPKKKGTQNFVSTKKKNETKQKQKTKQKIWRLVHLMN